MENNVRIVIIGGGVIGCSTAWHLSEMGCTDVVLLEMNELTSGSTWHAAGNIPTYSTSRNIMKLQRYSTEVFEQLAADPQFPINYHQTGSLRLARNQDRVKEFKHSYSVARAMGLEYELLDRQETKRRHPFLNLENVEAVLWDPYDGDIDPSQLTQAYARKAKLAGISIERFSPVIGITQNKNDSWTVSTEKVDYTCEVVINAGGYRGAEIAAMVGQFLPIVSMQHQFLVTESVPDLVSRDALLPLLRDPDDSYYLRQEGKGLILGPYEWQATPHWADGKLPEDFAYQLYPDDLERLEWYIEAAVKRVPILGEVGVQKVINGPIPYSPDGNPYIGPAFGLKNFFHCCSFSFGICQSGGAGKSMAEWVLDGRPEWDLWSLDPRRYTSYATQTYVVEKAVELYQNEYAIPYPIDERAAGRPARVTPLYSLLQSKGARFGARGGWERATWFNKTSSTEKDLLSFARKKNWFDSVAAECINVQKNAGVLDLGGFSKFDLKGEGAADWLRHMIAGNLPKPGRIGLSYFCHEGGGVWSELTITRLGENHFWLISAAAAEWHDEQWLRGHLPENQCLSLKNITNESGTLVLAGPRSRDILQKMTRTDLSNKAFPWLSCQTISLPYCTALALRVNYVGELGWELHVSNESLLPVYEALMKAGEEFSISDFGMYAMESMRLEKCYRAWKVELDSEYSPLRSGLNRFVNLKKDDFIGKQAIIEEQEKGLPDVFASLIIDDQIHDAIYGCTIYHGDEKVGYITSGGYGHRIGESIGLGYIRTDLNEPGIELSVDIFGQRRRAVVVSEPVYDPDNTKLRA